MFELKKNSIFKYFIDSLYVGRANKLDFTYDPRTWQVQKIMSKIIKNLFYPYGVPKIYNNNRSFNIGLIYTCIVRGKE